MDKKIEHEMETVLIWWGFEIAVPFWGPCAIWLLIVYFARKEELF